MTLRSWRRRGRMPVARSACPGYASARMASELAKSIAAPVPWTARAPSSTAMFGASAQASEETVNNAHSPDEDAAAAEAVGDGARAEHDGGQGERVGVDDPLDAGQAGVQVAGDVRQRRVDDRDVEHQHRRREADHGERARLAEHGDLPSSRASLGQVVERERRAEDLDSRTLRSGGRPRASAGEPPRSGCSPSVTGTPSSTKRSSSPAGLIVVM